MSIYKALRSHTKPHHDRVETALNSSKISDASLDLQEYRQLITINYLIFNSLKDSIRNKPELQPLFIDRLNDLKKDLRALNIQPGIPDTNMFEGWNECQLLGALYVLNGSSLGGHMIAQQLEEYDWISDPHFYRSDRTIMKQWKSFKKHLKSLQVSKQEADKILDGAEKTYEYFIKLSEEKLSLR